MIRFSNRLFIAILILGTGQILWMGCNHFSGEKDHAVKKNEVVKKDVAINTPLAVFRSNLQDAVTDNDFIVKIFPLADGKMIRLDIRFGGNEVEDSVQMLPPDYYKKMAIHPGSDSNNCIVGFIDNDNHFREMIQIFGSPTAINLKTLHEYFLQ
jgi:hypothetical protein